MTTLGGLTKDCSKVYLDTSIINRDKNYKDLEEYQRERDCGFSMRIGSAKSFSDIKESILLRQQKYSSKLIQVIKNNQNIKSTIEIMKEYEVFVDHIERVHDYLTNNSVKTRRGKKKNKKGKKGSSFSQIIHDHNQIIKTLTKRSKYYSESQEFIKLINDERLHLPRSNYLTKKTGRIKPYPDEADASLFACALVDASYHDKPVAIITCDFDIANMAQNYKPLMDENSRSDVIVYFPDMDSWVKDFSVKEKSRASKKIIPLNHVQSQLHNSYQDRLIKSGFF